MNFVSLEFLLLLTIVATLYPYLEHRRQNLLLLAASLIFYGWWDWRFLSLLLFSAFVDYAGGILVDQTQSPQRSAFARKLILVAALSINLSVLALFKYFDFFSASLVRFAGFFGLALPLPALHLVLPVGISFYTFQSMSYTIDIYRGTLRSTTRFLDFLLFVTFFPQLVAGPIERAQHLLPQVLAPRTVTAASAWDGLQLALVGYFKKMVIADNVALIANNIFGLEHPSGPQVLLGAYAFAVQIYCDFSGYSDIARGIGRLLGFDICENFRLPYLATNPREFWQRWHISLSTWLRDYVYISLGGNRGGAWRTYRNLALTMLLGGLWHGAAWHFVLWGAYHGFLLIVHRLWTQGAAPVAPVRRDGLVFWMKVIGFFHLTCFGWLIFRARDLGHLGTMLRALGNPTSWAGALPVETAWFSVAALALLTFQRYQYSTQRAEPWKDWPLALRTPFALALGCGILLLGSPETYDFIYFQF